jgi:hypothetical protein
VSDGHLFEGPALKGLTIRIAMTDGRKYLLRLDQLTGAETTDPTRKPITFWASPNTVVEDYDFTVKKVSRRDKAAPSCDGSLDDRCLDPGFKEHLCKGLYRNKDELWTDSASGIVFEGDYFDPKKTDQPPNGSGYFYLACVGTAAAKMHLLRHTSAGALQSPPRMTTPDQRTTMLKAITADYCGDGKSWTADGTPLFWTDARSWFPDPSARKEILALPITQVEAIWGPNGVLCLNDPRRKPAKTATCPNPTNPTKVPAVQRSEVAKACLKNREREELPRCDPALVASWKKGKTGYVISVNDPANPGDYCSE